MTTPSPEPTGSEYSHSIEAMLHVSALLFDNISYAISLHDNLGQLQYCNQPMLNSVGKTNLQEFASYLQSPDCELYRKGVSKALQDGQAENIVLSMGDRRQQAAANSQVSFFPIKDKLHGVIGVLAYSHSLDFIKHAYLQNTRSQRAYLRTLLDNLPYPIWMKNSEGLYLAVNRQFCHETGYDHPRDVLGKLDLDLFPEDVVTTNREDERHVLQSGQEKRLVEKINRPDGSSYWGYSHLSPVRADDAIIGTVGFTIDISEERRLINELSELENEYALLLNNLPMAIIVYDELCRRTLINQFYTQLIGIPTEELVGKRPVERWSSDIRNMDGATYEFHLRSVMQSGLPANFELIAEQSDNQLRVFDVRLIPRQHKVKKTIGVIAILQDVTEKHHSKLRMQYEAHHDALTALPNRTLLKLHLQGALHEAAMYQRPLAVMALDLDGFKAINDSLGHTYGDLLLKEMSERIRKSGSGSHFCARMGGDEFAVVHSKLHSRQEAMQLANQILDDVLQIYRLDQAECYVSASIGIAMYPDDGETPADLLKHADVAMYAAKERGRNNSLFYQPSLTKRFERQFHLSNALRLPETEQEISLEYQPIVNLLNHQIVGVEALCRWHSRVLGSVPPMEFIHTAEQTGLIMSLGLQMMRQAFEAAHHINHESPQVIKVSLNISARQFSDPHLVQRIQNLLMQTRCKPEWIKFEITETLLLEFSQEVLVKLNQLNQLGITIVLDDFGTGHAALSYLLKFPLQQIKIDKSFIHDIETNPNSAKLVKAVIGLISTMGKELVAEGIETDHQAELMKAFGCHMVQGFLYSRPMPLQDLLGYARQEYAL